MAEMNLNCGNCLFGAELSALESVVDPVVKQLNKAQGELLDSFIKLKEVGNAPVEAASERAKRDQKITHAEQHTFGSSADVIGVLTMIDTMFVEARSIDCSAQDGYPSRCPRLGRVILDLPQITSEARATTNRWRQKGN